MPAFEPEFTRLMAALWTLNKSTSNPYARREIGHAMTRTVPQFDYARPAPTAEAAAGLQRDGFHRLGACLSAQEVTEVRERLREARLYDSQSLNYQSELVQKALFRLEERPPSALLATYESSAVLACPPLVRLACDPGIVAAVEAYIGCTPTVSAFAAWHTFPGQVDAPAEVFHRDRDCFRFVKLFVYLSDVDAAAGPHEFIRHSHNPDALQAVFQSSRIQVDLPRLFEGNSRNLRHADLQAILGRHFVTTTGPAGSGFLEDTYGLHRGTRPASTPRLIFSVTYTGLPLRYANENDRAEMNAGFGFAQAGIAAPSELQRYLFRFFLQ